MNSKLEKYLTDQIALIKRLDTDHIITQRKRHFLAQKMLLAEILEANNKGEFDEV
jgi:hypothetical protein